MATVSDLYATLTPTPYVIPISDGSGTLNDWVDTFVNPMTSEWDLVVGGVGGDPDRLAVGFPGDVLTVGSGGNVEWLAGGGGFVNPMTTSQDLIIGGLAGAPGRLGVGSLGQVLTVGSGGIVDWETPAAAGGTVTSVSVVSANGFAGSVATATTTPAITLTTTITGILQGNGTAISAATTTGTGDVVLATGPTFPTKITIGAAAGTTGSIEFKGTTSGTVTLSVADAAGTNTFKLPSTAGSNTNVLATDGSGNLFWQAAAAGTGTINSGTANQVAYYATSSTTISGSPAITINATTTAVSLQTTARSSGVVPYLTVTAPADTAQTAGTESIGVSFLGAIRQHASNTAITSQREYVFAAPTYSFASATGTITNAATVAIVAEPTVGTNAAITNAYALWLQSGSLGFGASGSISRISSSSGNISLVASGTNQNIQFVPSGTGIIAPQGDVVSTDNASFRTWQGLSGLIGRGVYSQRAGSSAGFYALGVGAVDAQWEGSVAGGSYGSLSATASGRSLGINFRSYGGTTWAVPAAINLITTQTQSETARGAQILFKTTANSTTTLNTVLTLDQDQTAVFSSSVKTGAPSGGTAAFWKLGSLVTAAVTPDITRYIQLDVGGTLYKVIIST